MTTVGRVRCACAFAQLIAAVGFCHAQSASPLRLERTIVMQGVQGRIDHLAYDADNQRLFVAALGNNTVEIIDLKNGKVEHTIGGLAEPQGVLYEPQRKRIWIANGGDGSVRIFDARTYQLVRSIQMTDDADNIRYEEATGRNFVGYGNGGIAVFDPDGNKVADIQVDAHPESFQLEKSGSRIYVNLPRSQKVAVIDRRNAALVADWPIREAQSNFPMALDEANGRLFIVCRTPAVLLVLDTRTGVVVAKLPTVSDSDDVFYDQTRRRIYVSGGGGAIVVYQQKGADQYSKIALLEAVKGARTSLFVPQLNSLFLAVRKVDANEAAIRVYKAIE
jgi:YVTN family beta-propeller protein